MSLNLPQQASVELTTRTNLTFVCRSNPIRGIAVANLYWVRTSVSARLILKKSALSKNGQSTEENVFPYSVPSLVRAFLVGVKPRLFY
jgi:hypothetical protein